MKLCILSLACNSIVKLSCCPFLRHLPVTAQKTIILFAFSAKVPPPAAKAGGGPAAKVAKEGGAPASAAIAADSPTVGDMKQETITPFPCVLPDEIIVEILLQRYNLNPNPIMISNKMFYHHNSTVLLGISLT